MDVDPRLINRLAALAFALTDEVTRAAETAAGPSGVAPAALVALHESSAGESVERLRAMVGLTPSGAVRLVDRLAILGLVSRRAGRDNRSVAVALTPRGRRAARRVMAARAAATERVVSSLTARDQATLLRLGAVMITEVTRNRLEQRRAGSEPPGGALCRLCDFQACRRDAGDCPVARTAADS